LEVVKVNVIAKTSHSINIHGPGIPGPVAIATIDRPAIGRRKRYFGLFAALGAYGREHLAREPIAVATISIPLCLLYLSA
jgi:hypothetical protein